MIAGKETANGLASVLTDRSGSAASRATQRPPCRIGKRREGAIERSRV